MGLLGGAFKQLGVLAKKAMAPGFGKRSIAVDLRRSRWEAPRLTFIGRWLWRGDDGIRRVRTPASKGGQCCKCASYANPKCKALGRPVRRKKSGRWCHLYERRA